MSKDVGLKKIAFPVLCLFALASACLAVYFGVKQYRMRNEVLVPAKFVSLRGQIAPAFSVKTLGGRRYTVPGHARPVALEIIATWCDDCKDEVRAMNKFARRHPQFETLAVVGDNRGQNQQPEVTTDIRSFVQKYHVRYPVSAIAYPAVANAYQTWGYPSIVFIRKDGVIEWNIAGTSPYAALAAAATDTERDDGVAVRPGPVVFPTP